MSTQPLILVAEDEDLMRVILSGLLEGAGYRVALCASAEEALEKFTTEDVAVTLTDIRMAGMDGLQLLDRIKDVDAEALVVVMTAYSSVETAVAALRKGAYDYVTKPFVNEDLLQSVKNALRQRELFSENRALRRELDRRYSFAEIVGTSEALQQVFRLVEKVAATTARARSWWRARFITTARAPRAPLSPSTAARCRKRCLSRSCSVTRKARSRARSVQGRDCCARRKAGRFFSTRSARSVPPCRSDSCAPCRSMK
jgi:CheY-like chemotaxis protein